MPSNSPLYGVLQKSTNFKEFILPTIKKVAKVVNDANYSGASTAEVRRTAFANKLLDENPIAINRVVSSVFTQNQFSDLNLDNDTLNNQFESIFTSGFDAIAGAF